MTPMNNAIEVSGWDAAKGAAVRVSTYNAGWRNRRNRWSVDDQGDHVGALSPDADHADVKDPSDRRKKVGVAFNRGHLYDVVVEVDGEYEHTLLVDASDDYQVISYYQNPGMRVKAVRASEATSVFEGLPLTENAYDDSDGDDEDGPFGDREVGATEEE